MTRLGNQQCVLSPETTLYYIWPAQCYHYSHAVKIEKYVSDKKFTSFFMSLSSWLLTVGRSCVVSHSFAFCIYVALYNHVGVDGGLWQSNKWRGQISFLCWRHVSWVELTWVLHDTPVYIRWSLCALLETHLLATSYYIVYTRKVWLLVLELVW